MLCDIELGGGERGFELLEAWLPDEEAMPAVVFFSAYDFPAFHVLAMARGAAGYLLKTAPLAEILEAIRRAAAAARLSPPAISVRLDPPRARRRAANSKSSA